MKRCDICSSSERLVKFNLIHLDKRAGRVVHRGAGVLFLCQRCWRDTAAKRRRKPRLAVAA